VDALRESDELWIRLLVERQSVEVQQANIRLIDTPLVLICKLHAPFNEKKAPAAGMPAAAATASL
jgi:hypothetical protein